MIVCFGSINLDMIFQLKDMPQPGQTLLASSMRTEPGGKGANQALAAARDGADVIMAGAVGCDAMAGAALAGMTGTVDLSAVAKVDAPTGCAVIQLDAAGRNMITVASGANLSARADQVDDRLLADARVMLLQMETAGGGNHRMIERCEAAGVLSILNLAPFYPLPADVLSRCGLIVVNEDEAADLAQWLGCQPDADALAARLGTGIVRTLGGEGAEGCFNGASFRVPAHRVDVIDTTAAGDCFVGVLASGLSRGLTVDMAMRRASAAAAIACSRAGSQLSLPYQDETTAMIG